MEMEASAVSAYAQAAWPAGMSASRASPRRTSFKQEERVVFRSLHSKIILLVLLSLAMAAVAVVYLVDRDVEDAMLHAEERSIANVLQLVQLDLNGVYRTLLLEKVRATQDAKKRLRLVTEIAMAGLARHHAMVRDGVLSEEQAKAQALAWLASLPADEDFYFFAFDEALVAVHYPDPERVGRSLEDLKDIKGRSVAKSARQDTLVYSEAEGAYTAPALHGPGEVKRYAHLQLFEPWGWRLAASVNIGFLEQEIDRRVQDTMGVIAETLPKVRIAETGFVFLFNEAGDIFALPSRARNTPLAQPGQALNAETGRPLLAELRQLADAAPSKSPFQNPEKAPDTANATAAEQDIGGPYLFQVAGPDGLAVAMQMDVASVKAAGVYIAAAAPMDEIEAPASALLGRLFLSIAGALLLSLLVALALARRIATPIRRLTDHANALSTRDFSGPAEEQTPIGDLPRTYKDEVGRLAEAFLFMETSLRENIASLMEVTAAKQRIESELQVARDIQLGLLHKIFPPFPERRDMDLYAVLFSAREVGGDLYDFFLVDDNRLCVVIGDVSGKGVPAALFMAVTKTLVKAAAERDPRPTAIMDVVNEQLAQDNPNVMFVTLIVGVLDLSTGRFEYACGGHNPPLLLPGDDDPDRAVRWISGVSGPMVGVMPGITYKPLALDLAPGDAILLYTDGVTEAMNHALALYGDDRLEQTVAACEAEARRAPHVVVERVLEDVHDHAAGAEPSDDITLLCIAYYGSEGAAVTRERAARTVAPGPEADANATLNADPNGGPNDNPGDASGTAS